MKRLPPLNLLLALDATARHQSVTHAALELHLTTSAISHRLSKLQEFLGSRLFVKTNDGVALTPEGRRYSAAVHDLLQQMADLSTSLGEPAGSFTVKLRAGPSFTEFWVLPRLTEFRRMHPHIHVELEGSFKPVDFRKDPVDLWVSRGPQPATDLVAETIMTEHFIPLASPAYLAHHTIVDFVDLPTQAAIYCSRSAPNWSDWFARYVGVRHNINWGLAFSQAAHALKAATQGLGVVLESREIAQAFIRDQRLVPVFAGDAGIDGPGHVLRYPARHLDRPAVAAFRSWLVSIATHADASSHGLKGLLPLNVKDDGVLPSWINSR